MFLLLHLAYKAIQGQDVLQTEWEWHGWFGVKVLLSLKVPLSYIPRGFFFSYWVVAIILPRVLDRILVNLHKIKPFIFQICPLEFSGTVLFSGLLLHVNFIDFSVDQTISSSFVVILSSHLRSSVIPSVTLYAGSSSLF